ncbi:hypothetical protein E2C01_013133 [Portunus trituberculatus]|uniref:Uncharacterized protein n=1 Tax=Portunus trituberculatus TaxID=210409 RepID=A0A5B7DFU4_PORTR|nr:hypothetical protein [Portunus trituberculatus]
MRRKQVEEEEEEEEGEEEGDTCVRVGEVFFYQSRSLPLSSPQAKVVLPEVTGARENSGEAIGHQKNLLTLYWMPTLKADGATRSHPMHS